jgi:hypothetical protein
MERRRGAWLSHTRLFGGSTNALHNGRVTSQRTGYSSCDCFPRLRPRQGRNSPQALNDASSGAGSASSSAARSSQGSSAKLR